ncbi:MAG TPA: WecB/TagA/CpsF family glycosyltransferase [Candidatus Blautia pullicola]|jgi:N-acetylglucosaminyldiphosphoundecaprenol N-acetyl-beta-D-mannosaminyltransferase|uniref:WecB/TagA/CpsF family glycosyltransferase n=1 Tax=Candidatus Blautia pullicola TaxID=2838498 RepID=A0A9D2FPU5_9FIRM|nr:WecB/TagA/CpsF family glycosyltransferase [Candidatus Blautia pullicola]
MKEKIEIMGISVEKCYAEQVMESINDHWNSRDSLSTYGILNMGLIMAAQKDGELKEYIQMLDKAVVDEPEVLKAAGLQDSELEQEASGHGFFGTLFWLLDHYRNHIFILGENREDTEKLCAYLQEKYPQIVIVGKDSLPENGEDQADRLINEMNAISPQAVLSCSKNYELEKFVKRNRKMVNTSVWFSLGSCPEILKETGLGTAWLNRLMEKSNFKKMVSSYKENEKI